MTLPELRKRQDIEARAYLYAVLEAHQWALGTSARYADLPPATMLREIDRLGLREEYDRRSPGPGRPRTRS